MPTLIFDNAFFRRICCQRLFDVDNRSQGKLIHVNYFLLRCIFITVLEFTSITDPPPGLGIRWGADARRQDTVVPRTLPGVLDAAKVMRPPPHTLAKRADAWALALRSNVSDDISGLHHQATTRLNSCRTRQAPPTPHRHLPPPTRNGRLGPTDFP